MASKRCISIDFYNSDDFITLPHSTIVLYTYLNLYADDYGIVVNPKTVMRLCGANDVDISNLISKGYLIEFDSRKIAVTHWKVHNQIQPSKQTFATNISECKQLGIVDDTQAYVLLSEERRQIGGVSPLQYKTSKDKTSKDKIIQDKLIQDKKIKDNSRYDEENERELLKGKQSETKNQSFPQNVDNLSNDKIQNELEKLRQSKK